ncbi:DNA-binding response regulator [Denitratisoma sp. DHT3]|uniref:response regulator transcription factor n=1 Tax=Denitratisoma sp. DHT3 TaxID=1981880 RepID=UPI001198C110|nr:sigma-70 family RNA polymerase sigma factor [Denitratisoma sp. DHT3]QDX82712.1 DNA-binding response regulator [Denitratisoma sp. DHT3]
MDDAVFIVDDDASVRDALGLLLGLRGYRTVFFADAPSFLAAFDPAWRGCLLVDIRMPGMDGLALQRRLREMACSMPVIVITGHGDVASTREAFRADAVDFLEKPLDEDRLIQAIGEALARQASRRGDEERRAQLAAQLEELTPREREVMDLVVAGRHNRDIARELGISVRTVEVHKARMMTKLKVDGIPQLVRISLGLR